MNSILIVYRSKYGATKEIIDFIEKSFEQTTVITPEMFGDEYSDYKSVFIASGVYSERLHPEIISFIEENQHWLSEKRVGLLGVAMGPERLLNYLESFKGQLGHSESWIGAAHGRITLNLLTAEDYSLLKSFSERVGMPFTDRNFMKSEEIEKISKKLQLFFSNKLTF